MASALDPCSPSTHLRSISSIWPAHSPRFFCPACDANEVPGFLPTQKVFGRHLAKRHANVTIPADYGRALGLEFCKLEKILVPFAHECPRRKV